MSSDNFQDPGPSSATTSARTAAQKRPVYELVIEVASNRCCIPSCPGQILYEFPKESDLLRKWLIFCGFPNLPDFAVRHYRLCSVHFERTQFANAKGLPGKLSDTAVPSRNGAYLPYGFSPDFPEEPGKPLRDILVQALAGRKGDAPEYYNTSQFLVEDDGSKYG